MCDLGCTKDVVLCRPVGHSSVFFSSKLALPPCLLCPLPFCLFPLITFSRSVSLSAALPFHPHPTYIHPTHPHCPSPLSLTGCLSCSVLLVSSTAALPPTLLTLGVQEKSHSRSTRTLTSSAYR